MKKNLLHVLLFCVPFLSSGQKENTISRKVFVPLVHYGIYEDLHASYYSLEIRENYVGKDGVFQSNYYDGTSVSREETPYIYLISTLNQTSRSSSPHEMLLTSTNQFLHIELEVNDLVITQEEYASHPLKLLRKHEMDVSFYLNAHLRISLVKKEGKQILLDVFTTPETIYNKQFLADYKPEDGVSLTANSKDEVEQLWAILKHHARLQWRRQAIEQSLKPLIKEYNDLYTTSESLRSVLFYSDKNRKGGFDEIVNAENKFRAAVKNAGYDLFKESRVSKVFWVHEIQKDIGQCLKIWEDFLLTKNISDDYRKKISYNYILGLIFTGQFDRAKEILKDPSHPFKPLPHADLKEINKWLTPLEREFNNLAEQKGWVRLQDT